MKWATAQLLAIDSETTGIEPGKDRIVELGACALFGAVEGHQWKRFGDLVNPGMPIPAEASALHGITDQQVRDKPRLVDLAPRFLARVREAEVLVGYNWPFDAAMLAAELGAEWTDAVADKPVLDALVVVRLDDVGRFWPGKGRHKLDAVAKRLGIPRRGSAHRASSDAELAIRILFKCCDHLPKDARAASDYIAQQRVEQKANFDAWLASQPARESA